MDDFTHNLFRKDDELLHYITGDCSPFYTLYTLNVMARWDERICFEVLRGEVARLVESMHDIVKPIKTLSTSNERAHVEQSRAIIESIDMLIRDMKKRPSGKAKWWKK